MSFKGCLPRYKLGIDCTKSLSLLAVRVSGGGGGGSKTGVKQVNREKGEDGVRHPFFCSTQRLV